LNGGINEDDELWNELVVVCFKALPQRQSIFTKKKKKRSQVSQPPGRESNLQPSESETNDSNSLAIFNCQV